MIVSKSKSGSKVQIIPSKNLRGILAGKIDSEWFKKEPKEIKEKMAIMNFLESLDKLLLEKSITLYSEGKIGLKKAWKLSGLTFFEFTRELEAQNIEPPLSEEVQDYAEKVAKSIKEKEIFV